MKTQIITVESHDDFISVRDRMSWAKTPRILLVIPKFEKVALRQAEFKILQRHASALGAQLGVVTRVRRIRAAAEELGITVFKSTVEAQKKTWNAAPPKLAAWRPPKPNLREERERVQVREGAWRTHLVVRLSAFMAGALSVFAIVALFIPRAQVRLHPVVETQNAVLPVTASEFTKSAYVTGNIPMREMRVILDGDQIVTVTGEGATPQSKARGVVLFRNLTANAVTIPEGAIVETTGVPLVQFVTLEAGAVSAGVGKTFEVLVEALVGGAAGNMPADSLLAIRGALGLSLTVTNPEPTSGGRDKSSAQASDADRARVKEALMRTLDERARNEFLEELEAGDILFDETIAVSQIFLEEYDPPAGAAGSTLTLTVQAEYSARYASASDLTTLAALALNASLPAGFHPISNSALKIDSVGSPTIGEDGSARWRIRAERQIVQTINPAQIVYLIRGLSVDAARSRLEKAFTWKNEPEISMSPAWWQWVPLPPFQIEVMSE